jgi:sarcosine oxidase subunit beta
VCRGYYLAKERLKPVVIRSRISAARLGQQRRRVRQSARNLKEMPWPWRASCGQLHEELEMDVEYVRRGNLRICTTEEDLATMRKSVENQRTTGLELVMLDRQQVLDLNPYVGEKVLGATYCPTDGHVNPFLVTYGF